MAKTILMHVRIDPAQQAELTEWCDYIGESQASVIRAALREYFIAHQTRKQLATVGK